MRPPAAVQTACVATSTAASSDSPPPLTPPSPCMLPELDWRGFSLNASRHCSGHCVS